MPTLTKQAWNQFALQKQDLARLAGLLLSKDICFSLTVEDGTATLTAEDYQSMGDFSATTVTELFPEVKSHSLWEDEGRDKWVKVRLHFYEEDFLEHPALQIPSEAV